MFYTTLRRIRGCWPCVDGWNTLLSHLGKTHEDDDPLSLLQILESNGLVDAVWALRAIDDCPEIRLFAVRCVREECQPFLTDQRSLNALDVSEMYAVGEADDEELKAAADAAWDAARDEAQAAALDAARAAAAVAAWEAALDAAGEAAWEAAWYAAWAAAWEAERQKQSDDFRAIFCSA